MTTEEIEKTAEKYTCNLRGAVLKDVATSWFIIGALYADSNWQEKTRWRSLLTTPPKLPSNPSEEKQVLVRHAKGGYDVRFLVKQSSIDYWLREGFVIWKEIE